MFKVNNKHIDVVLVFLSLSLTYFTTFSSASIINFEQVNVSWVIWILPSFNLPTRLSIFRNKMFKVRHKNNRIFSDNKDPVKYLWRSFVTKILKMIKAIYFRKKALIIYVWDGSEVDFWSIYLQTLWTSLRDTFPLSRDHLIYYYIYQSCLCLYSSLSSSLSVSRR